MWSEEELTCLKACILEFGKDFIKLELKIPTKTRRQINSRTARLRVTLESAQPNLTTEEAKLLEILQKPFKKQDEYKAPRKKYPRPRKIRAKRYNKKPKF